MDIDFSKITIEEGIAIPPKNGSSGRRRKWPDLKIKQSVAIAVDDVAEARRTRNRATNAYSKRGYNIVTRVLDDPTLHSKVVRIWRVG